MVGDDLLSNLGVNPADVPGLPAKQRSSLINYLVRWEHHDAARRCLQQLLVTHSRLVSVYDNLARVYLAEGEGARALEIMQRRHALLVSNSSRILEAHAYLAAGNLASAAEIARDLTEGTPDLLSGWSLQADVCLAAGDMQAAEAAIRRREELRPDTASTAAQMARVWQAQGDDSRAILWARTALARSERDGRPPTLGLLRLLKSLYSAAGQPAQAEATTARLARRHEQELKELARVLEPEAEVQKIRAEMEPAASAAGPTPTSPPQQKPEPLAATPAPVPMATEVLAGAVDLSDEELARLDEALHRDFPHEAFRPGQADVIAAVLQGESVLAVMPTGAGKSLCYQLAAQELPGTSLIISPLIALMKDQLDGLPAAVRARATELNHTLDSSELATRLGRAAAGGYKLLYAAPERLRQRPFLHSLKGAGVSLLVVDEAHCVSLWGHDFRPDYHFIVKAWEELGRPPILGMTATATPRVRDDIQSALGQMRLIASDVHRPNLRLEARQFANKGQKNQALLTLCREIEGSGIVYATTRKKCGELALMLNQSGVEAIHYHAGIEDRAAAQEHFMNGRARVVVATIAFGMGVDKADVRFIVHYNPPKTLENYYQEAGRAGRDGLASRCILFHSLADKRILGEWVQQDALEARFLRAVYSELKQRLGAGGTGLVAVADLERDLVVDDIKIRVVVHFLEMSGLLERGFDLPRTSSLSLCRPVNGEDPELARFVEAARLRPGQRVSRDLLAISRALGTDPRSIEAQVLAWQDAGRLHYHGTGRDMLLTLPQAPADSRQRVAAMLAEYRAGQEGRLAEIMAYATTKRCRHGAISTYFGGRAIERCHSCDNCLGTATAATRYSGYSRTSRLARSIPKQDMSGPAATLVLQGVAQLPYPLGRSGLVRAMQGAGSSKVKADRFPLFGAMSGWTQAAIQDLIVQMEDEGLLAHFEKSGYRLLRLSEEGRTRLNAQVAGPPCPVPAPGPKPSRYPTKRGTVGPSPSETPTDLDQTLFEKLRAWRLETARTLGKPPFVVFHDSTLKRIAATKPADLEELSAVKGIGPAKLEQYGQSLLAIVSGQEDDQKGPQAEKGRQ
jgi:ATP-dependent DNA helicase RecQ